jgi:hypothetical protein
MGSSDVPDEFFDGILDEFRISKTLRSPSWIHFDYHNMFEADHEITIGAHESAPAGDHTVFFGSNF